MLDKAGAKWGDKDKKKLDNRVVAIFFLLVTFLLVNSCFSFEIGINLDFVSLKYVAAYQIFLVSSKKLSQCCFLDFFIVLWRSYFATRASISENKQRWFFFLNCWAQLFRLLNFALNQLRLPFYHLLPYVFVLVLKTNLFRNSDINVNNCIVYLFTSNRGVWNSPALRFSWISSQILVHGAFVKKSQSGITGSCVVISSSVSITLLSKSMMGIVKFIF